MAQHEGEIIVGVLGQWASGKTTASGVLIQYLGGEDKVNFINDRALLASQAISNILEQEESNIKHIINKDGSQEYESDLATVFLGPGEDLSTVDLNMVLFDLHSEIYDNVPLGSYSWIDQVRLELGKQIRQKSAVGKPIVIEAGFGTNLEPKGENPFSHTISDLFNRLDEVGIEPSRVKWIVIEVPYERRSLRNQQRPDTVPAVEFDRFAADGGDLYQEDQAALEEQGMILRRVSNDHDDREKFKADIIAAFVDMFEGELS